MEWLNNMMNNNPNIDNIDLDKILDSIPDIDTLFTQSMINRVQGIDANKNFQENVLPNLPQGVQNVLNGPDYTQIPLNQIITTGQTPVTTKQAPQQAQQQAQPINPYVDRSKSYQYKRFYGDSGFDAVNMNSMGLKGSIWSGNSVPYIRKEYTDAMHWLDDKLASSGVKIIYTSAMGGQHKLSSSGRGHGDGAKLDAQGIIPPNLYRELYNRRYFGEGTGAVGYEVRGSNRVITPDEYEKLFKAGKVTMANGNHYDFSNKYASEYLAQERSRNINPLKTDNTALAFTDTNAGDNIANPQGNLLPIEQMALANQQASQGKPQASMNTPSTNLAENALNNIRRIGTSMNYLWTNKDELIKNAPQEIADYFASGHDLKDAAIDVANSMLETYNIDLRKLGDRDPGNIAMGILAGIYANPVDFLFDFMSFGGAGVARKAISKVPYLSRVTKAGDVEKAIAAENRFVTKDVLKAGDSIADANKAAKEAGFADLTEAIQAAEETTKSKFITNEATKNLWDKLKIASDNIDELDRVYSPGTYVGKERMAITQKILRDAESRGAKGITFEQVRRDITPILDDLDKNGIDKFLNKKHLNPLELDVAKAKKLFDEEEILPISHMMAEVDKSLGKAGIQAARASGDLKLAGKFSTRAYGNASYKAIAEQWAKPQEYLTSLMDSYLEGGISGSILRGEFAPVPLESGKLSKNVSYLDRQLLEQGKLREALRTARKEPLALDDIAVDNDVLVPLKEQMTPTSGAGAGVLRDIGGTVRGTMLSSLGYLGPNAITGGINALMNSGPMIVADIISAIKTKGKLAKELGAFRHARKLKESELPILKQLDKVNNVVGGKSNLIDRTIQNAFAEIAAHAELRGRGIPFEKRFQAIDDMDKIKLGEVITDVKKAALINSTRNILPNFFNDIGAIANPFWKWTDTATQSTFRMLEKHPLMANILLCDIMGHIAFDKEMQNRLNLGVSLDKPYVSYRKDGNGNLKEISAEFIPLTTTLKFADVKNWKENPPQYALFGPIMNALGGTDRYGNPMKRPSQNGIINAIHGRSRYEFKNGRWEEIGGKGDEVLNTVVKSLIGPVNLYNKTVAPLLSPIVSATGQYYQPYDMATFGGFNRENLMANPVFAGNPARGRTPQDVINTFTGIYERDYDPRYDRMTPNLYQQLIRSHLRGQMRLQREGY